MTDLRISQAQARADSRFYAQQVEITRREQAKLRERVIVKSPRESDIAWMSDNWMK